MVKAFLHITTTNGAISFVFLAKTFLSWFSRNSRTGFIRAVNEKGAEPLLRASNRIPRMCRQAVILNRSSGGHRPTASGAPGKGRSQQRLGGQITMSHRHWLKEYVTLTNTAGESCLGC